MRVDAGDRYTGQETSDSRKNPFQLARGIVISATFGAQSPYAVNHEFHSLNINLVEILSWFPFRCLRAQAGAKRSCRRRIPADERSGGKRPSRRQSATALSRSTGLASATLCRSRKFDPGNGTSNGTASTAYGRTERRFIGAMRRASA